MLFVPILLAHKATHTMRQRTNIEIAIGAFFAHLMGLSAETRKLDAERGYHAMDIAGYVSGNSELDEQDAIFGVASLMRDGFGLARVRFAEDQTARWFMDASTYHELYLADGRDYKRDHWDGPTRVYEESDLTGQWVDNDEGNPVSDAEWL